MDGHAHAGHARRVRHGKIVAGLDGDLAVDLDLAAEMHKEGAVRDVLHRHPVHGLDGGRDPLAMPFVARVAADVARDELRARLHQIDGADIATGLADRRGDLAEHPGLVGDLDTHGQAIACTRGIAHKSLRAGAARLLLSGSVELRPAGSTIGVPVPGLPGWGCRASTTCRAPESRAAALGQFASPYFVA